MSEDNTSYLQIFLFFACVGVIVYFFLKYYDQNQALVQSKKKNRHVRKADKSAQPMTSIFYKYNHSSVESWLKWVKTQGKAIEVGAYETLRAYLLDGEPEHLGGLVSEVVTALVKFGHPDSFSDVSKFIVRINKEFNRYKNVNDYYHIGVRGLVELDKDQAFDFLRQEINDLRTNSGLNSIKEALVNAMVLIDEHPSLMAFWSGFLVDSAFPDILRADTLKSLAKKDLDFQCDLYTQIVQYLTQNSSDASSKEVVTLLRIILDKNKDLVNNGYDELWNLVVVILKNDKTFEKVLSEFICRQVIDTTVDFESKNLEKLLTFEEPHRSKFCDALAKRFNLTDKEVALTKKAIRVEHLKFKKSMIALEGSKKTKPIVSELERSYSAFKETFITGDNTEVFLRKPQTTGKRVMLPVLGGGDETAKQYTIRALAANNRVNFIYVDCYELISSNKILVLQSQINSNKPVIVYLQEYGDLYSMELSDNQIQNLKQLNRLVGVLSGMQNVAFVASVTADESTFISSPMFKELYDHDDGFDLQHVSSIVKPTGSQKKVILQDCVADLESGRLATDFDPEIMLSRFEGESIIEYLSFLGNFFEKSLLLEGKVSLDYLDAAPDASEPA